MFDLFCLVAMVTVSAWVTWAQHREITLAALHLQGQEGSFWLLGLSPLQYLNVKHSGTATWAAVAQLVEWAAS